MYLLDPSGVQAENGDTYLDHHLHAHRPILARSQNMHLFEVGDNSRQVAEVNEEDAHLVDGEMDKDLGVHHDLFVN
jgi:hypothetical protein